MFTDSPPPEFRSAPPSAFRARWLDLTPLIDIIFLLLLFFLLATRFTHHGAIALQLPFEPGGGASSAEKERAGWRGAILVRAHRDGRIDINGQTLPLEGVASRIKTLAQSGAGQNTAFIRPAPGVPLQRLVAIVDQVRAGGLRAVSLAR